MANPTTIGRLPAPHDCIEVSVTRWFHDEWWVRYSGTPKQLVAAGIVDSDMESKILSKKGGARIAKDGFFFKLDSGRVPAHVQWPLDEVVGFKRKVRGLAPLLQLPGMMEIFPDGEAPEDSDDEFTYEQLAEQFPQISFGMARQAFSVAAAIGASSLREWRLRDRRVGRLHRAAEWLSIGKVIAPNWTRGAA